MPRVISLRALTEKPQARGGKWGTGEGEVKDSELKEEHLSSREWATKWLGTTVVTSALFFLPLEGKGGSYTRYKQIQAVVQNAVRMSDSRNTSTF